MTDKPISKEKETFKPEENEIGIERGTKEYGENYFNLKFIY